MNTRQTLLSHRPLLPNLVPSSSARTREFLPPTIVPVFTSPPWAPVRENRPAVLWRESLAVVTGRLAHTEAWAFLVLAALTLPVVVLSQTGLWRLLTSGTLERAIHAFLLLPGGHG